MSLYPISATNGFALVYFPWICPRILDSSACDVGISPSKTLGWWDAQQTMWMGVYGFFEAPFCDVWYQVLPL